jgi:hypothetical protein
MGFSCRESHEVVLCTMVKTREMHRPEAYSTSESSPVGGVVLTKITPEDE